MPMLACPHRCIYCNQQVISGTHSLPSDSEVVAMVDTYLSTMDPNAEKRVAFFGGSFTCLPMNVQNRYLDLVQPYVADGRISGVQLSTRPDYIDEEILENLKGHGVTLVELGAQSLDDGILEACGRGHTVDDVRKSSSLIVSKGIELGLQMMVGLPGDTREKSMNTARLIHEFGATHTRIYPTLVVEGTRLAEMYRAGIYKPLAIEDAVDWCKDLYLYFTSVNVNVLRMGLHPAKDLRDGTGFIAGPFHPSFKELVMTSVWKDRIARLVAESGGGSVVVEVPERDINYAVGYNSSNRKLFPQVVFRTMP